MGNREWKVENVDFFFHFTSRRFYLYLGGLKRRFERLLKIYHIDNEVLKSIKNGDLIIDCGGNIGEFSRAILEKLPRTKNIEIILLNLLSVNTTSLYVTLIFSKCFCKKFGAFQQSEKQKFYVNSINADSSLVKPASYHEETFVEAVSLDDYFHKKPSHV